MILVKVIGFAAQNNSLLFKDFVDEMLAKGFRNFVVDLSECCGMDSTFMGSLVGVIHYQEVNGLDSPVTLVNANEYNKNLLFNLGLLDIFDLKEKSIPLPDVPMKKIAETRYDLETRVRMIREAHEELAKLNEINQKQFGQFLELLGQELSQDNKKQLS